MDKTRKSLWVASIFTLVVANAVFQTDSIDLFGLKLLVCQSELIAVGKLTISVLLFVFAMHSVVPLSNWFQSRSEDNYEFWESAAKSEIEEIENQVSGSETEDYSWEDQADPWIVNFHYEKIKRLKRLEILSNFSAAASGLVEFILRYAFTILVAFYSLFLPEQLSNLLKLFQ
ncbi:hypothetical protein [Roseovarius sp. THAF8]|uniref:hypothetical protein n=1 Tax=Roseovarius sp. THAF8 TaxID=2587846 RepID=UPI001268AB84|nr:hypothetical protein [Roseovarius sp. THAF8]